MDPKHFDHWTRALSDTGSRRSLVAASLAGMLALCGLPEAAAKKGKPKKKATLTACQALDKACGQGGCTFGTACCFSPNCDPCTNSVCVGAPQQEGALLPGTCGCLPEHDFLNGSCGKKPDCIPAGQKRGFSDIRCCSGSEVTDINDPANGTCLPGVLSCLTNADCVGGLCRGYVCAAPELGCLA